MHGDCWSKKPRSGSNIATKEGEKGKGKGGG